MDADEPGWPIIDDVFGDLCVGRSTTTARRYLRVRSRLYAFLDSADLAAALGAESASLLSAAREHHDGGAFWAVLGVDELVRCLPDFVGDRWLPDGLAEARTQLSLVLRVTAALGDEAARARTAAAVECCRTRLDARAPRDMPPARLSERFRSQPGPRW